jgi:hypothetical protein
LRLDGADEAEQNASDWTRPFCRDMMCGPPGREFWLPGLLPMTRAEGILVVAVIVSILIVVYAAYMWRS